MSILFWIIGVIAGFDLILYSFNRISSNIRSKNSQKIMVRDEAREKLVEKIAELNSKLKQSQENQVSKKDYTELNHKYQLLLNQFRIVNNKNKILASRVKKLKDKIY
ncbi:MAG: hypothetical protein JW791_00775 [Nanoarchaeota archaeon]|nr:hypothetical protein [Nanoarchaeota archaeon]